MTDTPVAEALLNTNVTLARTPLNSNPNAPGGTRTGAKCTVTTPLYGSRS